MAIPTSSKRWFVHDSVIAEFGKSFDEAPDAIEHALERSDTFWGSVYVIVDTEKGGDDADLRANAPLLAYIGILYGAIPEDGVTEATEKLT